MRDEIEERVGTNWPKVASIVSIALGFTGIVLAIALWIWAIWDTAGIGGQLAGTGVIVFFIGLVCGVAGLLAYEEFVE